MPSRHQTKPPKPVIDLPAMIDSPEWWAQPFIEGQRVFVTRYGNSPITVTDKGGHQCEDVRRAINISILAGTGVDTVVDGVFNGTLYVFDFVDLSSDDTHRTYKDRMHWLVDFGFGPNVVVVETATTPEQKQALCNRMAQNGGSVVFKRCMGQRSSSGNGNSRVISCE